ncbi:MAG: TIGR03936 family radical SAM-associated protein [Lachnospiraceae bacterium]|jgi:radical SAM-linked protein|nr:TIGR03936 family radical SAM-associated protein [Lachnospiraceae bacterium]
MKVRIKFAKTKAAKYIGHLDTMRFFQKAVRRAGIDVVYSRGFNPHQVMSFAAPLGLGLSGHGEYFDLEINEPEADRDTVAAELAKRLNKEMCGGFLIVAAKPLAEGAKNAMASVAAAAYTVKISEEAGLPIDWMSQFEKFMNRQEMIYHKVTKKGEREIDLRPLIYKTGYSTDNSGNTSLSLLLDASSANSIKPQFVIEAFFDYIGQQLPEYALSISREDIYANTGTAEKPNFVTLLDYI